MSKQREEIIPQKGTTLFVDIGNSSLKAAYIAERGWHNPHHSELRTAGDFVDWINRHVDRFELIVITSVVPGITDALTDGIETDRFRVLKISDIPSDLIDYDTPETLGLDRFFGCYGAVAHTQKPVVVIDAGTACTIDYMASDFMYRGGIIMPGLDIFEDAARDRLPSLPAVERSIPKKWPGKSTASSLQWGITGAYVTAIEGMLDRYGEAFGEYELVATGGSAELVAKFLDREIKVRSSLVFDGMNEFLKDYL